MKNFSSKGAIGALAIIGGLWAAKKIKDRRNSIRQIFDEYEIKERSPFGFADKIREMDDQQYESFKSKMKENFAHRCCSARKSA